MSLKKITFALLAILIYNFSFAQKHSTEVVDDISDRVVHYHANFNQHVHQKAMIAMYICADSLGNVIGVQVLRGKSTIKDLETLNKLANEALKMKFYPAQKSGLSHCGEMVFNVRKPLPPDTGSAGNYIGSRPTPPGKNIEIGDLNNRKILRTVNPDKWTYPKGKVVVYICADKYGRVIKAEPIGNQSTIKDKAILSQVAVRLKKMMKFSPGKITDCMYYTLRRQLEIIKWLIYCFQLPKSMLKFQEEIIASHRVISLMFSTKIEAVLSITYLQIRLKNARGY